jgi:hypothetical protein
MMSRLTKQREYAIELKCSIRFASRCHGLIEMAEMLKSEAEMRERRRARVLAENVGELVVLGPIHRQRALKMVASVHGVAAPHQGRAVDPVSHHQQPDIVLLLGAAQEPFGILQRSRHVAPHIRDHPLAVHHGKRVSVVAEVGAELPRAGVILGQFRGDVASRRNQRTAQLDAQCELARIARGSLGQLPKQLDGAPQMGCGFAIGRAPDGELSRLAPPLHGGLGHARVGVVVGEDFRLGLRRFGETGFQHLRYAPMQLIALASQQRLIGGVTYKCVLEDVTSSRRCAMRKNELGGDELGKRILELGFAHGGHRRQQGIGEFPADARRDLCHLLDR